MGNSRKALPDLVFDPMSAGMAPGHDALDLARRVALAPGWRALDMGTGQGVVALMLAAREKVWVTGVDLFPTVLESAKGNEVRNRGLLRGSVEWVLGDVRWLPFGAEVFDLVVLNPPYFRRGEGRVSSNPIRAAARHESFGTLGDWVREGAKALRFGGRLSCVLPLARVEEARGLFAESGLEEVCGEGNEGRAWVVLQAVRSSRSKSTA